MRYLVDTNVWLALTLSNHRHHGPCLSWFATVEEPASVVLPRQVQMSFLRLLTTAAVLAPHGRRPLTNAETWAVLDAIIADDRVVTSLTGPLDPADVTEVTDLTDRWRTLSTRPSASPKLWMDAYLAAYAVHAHLTLVTLDSAFAQFPGLSHANPAG